MSDCISRESALEVLDDYAEDIECGNWGTAYSKARASMCELPSVEPEIPPYVAEIEAEYKKWINVSYIRKPLAKALYEVWKKHDIEDAERRTDA